MIEEETIRFIIGEGNLSSGRSSGSRFIVLEANGGEVRAKNHVKNVNLDGVVGFEASTMMISARNGMALNGRKNLQDLDKKEGVVADGAFGVRKRDVRVKDKGKRVSVSLRPKANGRVIKPNNCGVGFSSKKVVSRSVVRDLLGCVGKDGTLG
ncbi:hypothetical protein PVK06_012166 [Gossypium arboreum]|uniref:Uncharacterized protein n=1 Tax=Gossypium arboreum TaxID=29729 RepID=A0ABR0QAM7_GOSAR|nr:hypothetical protein PVK06_012166 [Gossypium arboreum]